MRFGNLGWSYLRSNDLSDPFLSALQIQSSYKSNANRVSREKDRNMSFKIFRYFSRLTRLTMNFVMGVGML